MGAKNSKQRSDSTDISENDDGRGASNAVPNSVSSLCVPVLPPALQHSVWSRSFQLDSPTLQQQRYSFDTSFQANGSPSAVAQLTQQLHGGSPVLARTGTSPFSAHISSNQSNQGSSFGLQSPSQQFSSPMSKSQNTKTPAVEPVVQSPIQQQQPSPSNTTKSNKIKPEKQPKTKKKKNGKQSKSATSQQYTTAEVLRQHPHIFANIISYLPIRFVPSMRLVCKACEQIAYSQGLQALALFSEGLLAREGSLRLCIENGHNMKVLSLSWCSDVTNATVEQVCRSMPRLSKLDLSHCDGISDECLGNLLQLSQLRSLSLSFCRNIGSVEGMTSLAPLLVRAFQQQPSLDAGPSNSLPAYPLLELDLSGCQKVCDTSIAALFSANEQDLKKVLVPYTRRPAKSKVKQVLEYPPLGGASYLPSSTLRDTQSWQSRLETLSSPSLQAIRTNLFHSFESSLLASQPQVEDLEAEARALKHIHSADPNDILFCAGYPLLSFNLSNCEGVTDEALRTNVVKCKNIRILHLRECKWITQNGVASLSDSTKSLRILNLGRSLGIVPLGASTMQILEQKDKLAAMFPSARSIFLV